MNKLTKVVNIYPSMPITTVNPPIRSVVKNVTKSISEIRSCLMARATVEEVLADGKVIRLNIGNYDTDNTNSASCNCNGECTCGWKLVPPTTVINTEDIKTPWQVAYENALEGKDLTTMSRKQRRSAEAAARAVADAAVATPSEPEVIIGVGEVETTEVIEEEVVETVIEETPVEETTAEPVVEEEPVKTEDIEKLTEENVIE
jgi:hypothetical protein